MLRVLLNHLNKVGQLQRPNDKIHKPGAVKTMADVLHVSSNFRCGITTQVLYSL
jgi:hypothetical protein